MRLKKVWCGHFKCKFANKYLNIQRGVKSIPSLSLTACESWVPAKGNFDREKKNAETVDFVGSSIFIKGNTKAGFHGCSAVNL